MTERLKCMFDTNVFDELIDHPELIGLITGCVDVVATHVQRDEINQTTCQETKTKLCRVFGDIVPDEPHTRGEGLVSTESTVWNISKWNSAKWTKGDNLIARIRGAVSPYAEKRYGNRTRDALIAETAIKNGFPLVTEDTKLSKQVTSLGGRSMSWEQLLDHCRN